METKIPEATAKRLPLYYRYLNNLLYANKLRVSSAELAESIQVDAATIRRDFSYFGPLGKRGYGYDVHKLIDFFKKILDQNTLTNVALIGVGNLGHALLNFNFHKNSNVRISAAFDVNPKLIGSVQSNVPVYDMRQLQEQLKDQRIEIAIITVPATIAQKVVDELVQGGIKGIMNFTTVRISVPEGVRIQNIDLTNELQTLIYAINHG